MKKQSFKSFKFLRPAIRLAAIVIIGTQLGSSCATTDDTRYPDRNDRYPDRYDQHDDYNYRNQLPDDARLIKEGTGEMGFRAASNGRMWLYDERDRKVLYYVDLLDGDDVLISPSEDKIFINGRTAERMSLSGSRVNRIYFDGRRVYVDRNTSPRRDDDRNRVESKPPARSPLVPDSAKLVAEGKDTELSFKANENGKLYLFDNSNNVLVQTFTLHKGQRFTVSISHDVATIDGKTVMTKKGLSKRATYRLLFNS